LIIIQDGATSKSIEAEPWSNPMTATRPSFLTMTAFIVASVILFAAAAAPFVQTAAQVIA
jgi:hypothetical protein